MNRYLVGTFAMLATMLVSCGGGDGDGKSGASGSGSTSAVAGARVEETAATFGGTWT
ncbi:MAG: lipase, partial [Betaproteobacteria bacterium]|nr:lipase [Betaproteobacteria bacterium]